jgi:hypothetical protein
MDRERLDFDTIKQSHLERCKQQLRHYAVARFDLNFRGLKWQTKHLNRARGEQHA